MSANAPSRPLAGGKVLDFGHYMADPAVGMMLADIVTINALDRQVKGLGLGEAAHYRFYRARDGWFSRACADSDELDRLASLPDFDGFNGVADKVTFLEDLFAARPVAHWLETLAALGIGAVQPDSIAQLRGRQPLCRNGPLWRGNAGNHGPLQTWLWHDRAV